MEMIARTEMEGTLLISRNLRKGRLVTLDRRTRDYDVFQRKSSTGTFIRVQGVTLHSQIRRFLERSKCTLLRWVADGSFLYENLWLEVLQEVGYGRSLAYMGTARCRAQGIP